MKLNSNGQNIVEYILLVVAVLLVFFVFLNPHGSPLKNSVETTLNSTINLIDNAASEIQLPPLRP